MKKKRGRPKLPEERVKRVFPLRLSDNDLALFARAAKVKKKALREWMEGVLKKAAVQLGDRP